MAISRNYEWKNRMAYANPHANNQTAKLQFSTHYNCLDKIKKMALLKTGTFLLKSKIKSLQGL